MAGRRTNLALLVLVAGSLATGALAFAFGASWAIAVVVAHGTLGLGIVLLAPWKSVIARRGLRRRRPGAGPAIVFSMLTVVVVLTGVAHSTGLLRSVGAVTAMQVHVTAALVSIPFAVAHVLARPIRTRRTDLSRRNLLRAGGLAAGAMAAYGAVGGIVRLAGLPGGRRRFTGSYERGSFDPGAMPVTQWLDDSVPRIDPVAWRLTVAPGGRAVSMSLADVEARAEPVRATIDCTGGWYAQQEWEGVRLDRLLGPGAVGRSILVRSRTGYTRRFPFSDASGLWLATRAGGVPLSHGHGFPARIVAPGRRGFWWVKWVEAIEVGGTPWWWQPPFPVT